MTTAIHAFPEDAEPAQRLAAAMKLKLEIVDAHAFPDGESLPRVPAPASTTLVYRSLSQPNVKLIELLLASDAWRRSGARRLVLVAPYLPYMRQDKAFRPGEPISQRVIASLLDAAFDRIVTVDPHLHRTHSLGDLFQMASHTHLHAAPALISFLETSEFAKNTVIVGPDAESAPWVSNIAKPLGLESMVLTKQRRGDREVEILAKSSIQCQGKRAFLVDDICSTGSTLRQAVLALRAAGFTSISVYVTHALCSGLELEHLLGCGVERVISSDSCTHPTNAIHLAPVLAAALSDELGRN